MVLTSSLGKLMEDQLKQALLYCDINDTVFAHIYMYIYNIYIYVCVT